MVAKALYPERAYETRLCELERDKCAPTLCTYEASQTFSAPASDKERLPNSNFLHKTKIQNWTMNLAKVSEQREDDDVVHESFEGVVERAKKLEKRGLVKEAAHFYLYALEQFRHSGWVGGYMNCC